MPLSVPWSGWSMIVKVSGSPSGSFAVSVIDFGVSSAVGCAGVVPCGARLGRPESTTGGSGSVGSFIVSSGAANIHAGLRVSARASIHDIIDGPPSARPALHRAISCGLAMNDCIPARIAFVNSSSWSGFGEGLAAPRNVKLASFGPSEESSRTVLDSSVSAGLTRVVYGASKRNLNVTPPLRFTRPSRSAAVSTCHSSRPPDAGRMPITIPASPLRGPAPAA